MMQTQEKRILRKHRHFLVENLSSLDEICDSLIEDTVLTASDVQRIRYERSTPDEVRKLLDTLHYKDERAVPSFKRSLLKTEQKFICDKLEENCPLIQSKVDDDLKQFIHQVLSDTFNEEKDGRVSINEVNDVLQHAARRLGRLTELDDVDPGCLVELVKEKFDNCKVESQSPRNKHKRSCLAFVGLWAKSTREERELNSERQSSDQGNENSEGQLYEDEIDDANSSTIGTYRSAPFFRGMSTEKLFEWMKELSKDLSISTDIAEKFKEQEIDGLVFENMTDEEMEKFVPKFGPRKKIMMEKNKILKESSSCVQKCLPEPSAATNMPFTNPKLMENFRSFDRSTKLTDKYRKGAVMAEGESRIKNLIDPVHKFSLPGNIDILTYIAIETVKFGAACINEKTNGTIHFGIAGMDSKDQNYTYGEIVGIPVNKEKYQKCLTEAICNVFFPEQQSKALSCIRPAQFVEVSQGSLSKQPLYVMEVDVVSSYEVVKDEAFFLQLSEDEIDQKACTLLRYCDNGPSVQNKRDTEIFMKEKCDISDRRRDAENRRKKRGGTGCHLKAITDFLCCGRDQIECDIYPLLFINAPDCDIDNISLNFSFLKNIAWRAVFDFDCKGNEGQIYKFLNDSLQQVFQTKQLEDFNEDCADKKELLETYEELRESNIPPWIFCNNESEESAGDATSWKLKCSKMFRKILQFYRELIPSERARVLFILLSKQYNIMQEAAIEVLVEFQDQCLTVAETDLVATQWKDGLLKGHCIDAQKLEENCAVGLPWRQLNQAINEISGETNTNESKISRSNDIPCILTERFKKELSDLEVLGHNDCKNLNENLSDTDKEEMQRNVGEEFYTGGQVSWLNFYYKDQVLKREKFDDLYEIVRRSMDNVVHEPDECVGSVAIYHQPGSGGTTIGKQILWDLRLQYRCCTVRKITGQTANQILRLFEYEDHDAPRPILVFIDNADDDKITPLYEGLQKVKRSDEELFCVLLVCFRKTEMPANKKPNNIMLFQKLSQFELNWFTNKNKDLIRKHQQKKGCNPNQLLSFNIMKENYSKECIQRSVAEFVQFMNSRGYEGGLVKYVAFVNTYDLDFQAIPAACFDPVMGNRKGWECRLSQSARVLLSRDNIIGVGGYIPAFRVSNSLLSRYILKVILELDMENTGKRKTIGEVASEFLHSQIFKKAFHRSHQHDVLLKIMINVVIKRHLGDLKREKFSPIVSELLQEGDMDAALDILSGVHELTDHHLVAQQIARLYEFLQKWDDAMKYADIAIQRSFATKHNSYLWHTKGQIQSSKLLNIRDQLKSEHCLNIQSAESAIQFTREAVDYYRVVQEMSRREDAITQNLAGYDGEIQIVLGLLDIIGHLPCFRNKDVFRTFLTCKTYCVQTELTENSNQFLKTFHKTVFEALETLENEILLVQEQQFCDQNRVLALRNSGLLERYKQELNFWFGSKLEIKNQTKQDQYLHNRRLAKLLGATSFLGVLKLGHNYDLLMKILQTIELNLNDGSASPEDYRIAIAVALSLPDHNRKIKLLEKALEWSRKFFDNSEKFERQGMVFEACLSITLLHWPSNKTSVSKECPVSKLITALNVWNEAVSKFSAEKRRRDRTLFYLCNGRDKHFFIMEESLKRGSRSCASVARKENIYRTHFAQRLLRAKGILRRNGHEIELKLCTQNEDYGPPVKITVANPLKRATLWNRPVYCVLGFGLYGIKAHDVTETDQSPPTTFISNQEEGNGSTVSSKQALPTPRQDRENLYTRQRQQWMNEYRARPSTTQVVCPQTSNHNDVLCVDPEVNAYSSYTFPVNGNRVRCRANQPRIQLHQNRNSAPLMPSGFSFPGQTTMLRPPFQNIYG